MEDVGSNEQFLRHLHHLVFTVLVEDDDIIDIGAVEEELVFLETRPYEAFLAIDIEFFVVLYDGFDVDCAEVSYLRTTRICLAVFLLQHLEPSDSIIRQMVEVLHASFDFLLEILHQFVRFLGIELGDTNHSDLKELFNILGAYLADELRFERREGFIHELNEFLFRSGVFVSLLLINTVLNENLLQRGIEIFLFQFAFLDLQFPFKQGLGVIGREAEEIADGGEDRFLILHHAAVGTDVHFAIGERIEGVDGFVGRRTGRQLYHDTRLIGGKVINLTNFNLSLLVRLKDGLDNLRSGGSERNLGDDKRLVVVRLLNTSTNLDGTASFTIVVLRYIDHAACREIGEKLKLFIAQVRQRSIAKLIEVMRQYLRVQTNRYTFYTLGQQQRELNRQMNRLVFTSVVGLHPLGRLRIKDRLQRKLRETRLNITRSCGAIPRKDVSPVTLAINQQIFLPQLDECIADRSIAVRVVLHCLADDIGYLVVLPVVHRLHGMQNTTLHRLETILNSRHSAFEYHIRSIVQEPVLVHAR